MNNYLWVTLIVVIGILFVSLPSNILSGAATQYGEPFDVTAERFLDATLLRENTYTITAQSSAKNFFTYQTAYYSSGGKWVPFNMTSSAPFTNDWVQGTSRGTVTFGEDTERYVIVYVCQEYHSSIINYAKSYLQDALRNHFANNDYAYICGYSQSTGFSAWTILNLTSIDPIVAESPVLVCMGMSNALQECNAFTLRRERLWSDEVNSELQIINCAVGGHAIEKWNDPEYDDILWGACNEKLQAAGVSENSEIYVWHKSVKQFQRYDNGSMLSPYPHLDSPYYGLQDELDVFAQRLTQKIPHVNTVFISGRSYGGYATNPERAEPYAYNSNLAIREWVRGNHVVNGVRYVQGPYFWAPDCANTTASFCYVRADYKPDGIHPATGANNKISRRIHNFFSDYAWYSS